MGKLMGGAVGARLNIRHNFSSGGGGGGVHVKGRCFFVSTKSAFTNTRLWLARLKDPAHPDVAAPLAPVVTAEDAFNSPLGVVGDTLYVYTHWQAPRGRDIAAGGGGRGPPPPGGKGSGWPPGYKKRGGGG